MKNEKEKGESLLLLLLLLLLLENCKLWGPT